ncbi:hypothetical protein LMH87_012185 [Akanthomyces muscarius]|uniref:Uncharacterized protein n=1 Tax=Akanthomyces muscarius TaxID=2231603 RepID=A0A9W8UKN8_AKAMU|nr:hypothetical protein LMH87_012185 [Akanthomyces muscarius]KAJ4151492.1 hypothetical protein LMH87_012185 [Akanthomyces muscarius]
MAVSSLFAATILRSSYGALQRTIQDTVQQSILPLQQQMQIDMARLAMANRQKRRNPHFAKFCKRLYEQKWSPNIVPRRISKL